MAERDEGFLSRWSRLKRAEEQAREASAELVPEPAGPVEAPPPAVAEPQEAEPDLPPIDSLTKDSDYTVFLRKGVAPELRRDAMRKLWRSDPVFANLDGLLEYGEDFGKQFRTPAVVATIYQVGRGMIRAVADDSPPSTEPAPAADAEIAAADAASTDTADANEKAGEPDEAVSEGSKS
jgi:hypothetical protein